MKNLLQAFADLDEMTVEEIKNQVNKILCDNKDNRFIDSIRPGYIVDMLIGDNIVYGIVLANGVLLMIDGQKHTVMGYLKDYTEHVPYDIIRIRKPNKEQYKYSSTDIPIVWQKEEPKVEMSLADIEKKLGIKSGTLVIK